MKNDQTKNFRTSPFDGHAFRLLSRFLFLGLLCLISLQEERAQGDTPSPQQNITTAAVPQSNAVTLSPKQSVATSSNVVAAPLSPAAVTSSSAETAPAGITLYDSEAARDRRWAERETPAARAQVAARFVELLNIDTNSLVFKDALQQRPGLQAVSSFLQKKDSEGAVKSFEDYYYNKLQKPIEYGFLPDDLSPYVGGIAGHGPFPDPRWRELAVDPNDAKLPPRNLAIKTALREKNTQAMLANANLLLQGKVNIGEQLVDIGPPGKVNWYYPFAYGQTLNPTNSYLAPNVAFLTGDIVMPLVEAYVMTHDERYLHAWANYIDDWSLNSTYLNYVPPCNVPSGVNSGVANSATMMVRNLAGLSAILPAGTHPLPTRVFAQMMPKLFASQPLLGITYLRSNCHNWTPGAALMLLSLMGDEFVSSPLFFRTCKRRNIEDNSVTQNLRDGAENQQDPWYNVNYQAGVSAALRMMAARSKLPPGSNLSWVEEVKNDPRWKNEIHEHLLERAAYQTHLRTPQGEWPIPFRGGDKRIADLPDLYEIPDAYADPVNRAITAVTRTNNSTPGDPNATPPPYNSEWFPYAGFTIIRDGWRVHDGYGALFCSPQPGAYGAFRSRSNNNSFGVAIDGQDLLVDDTIGHYMYPSSPVQVDGLSQYFHAKDGIYKVSGQSAHKSYMQSAWTKPAPWRWHASPNFNVAEGIYDGPYADPDHIKAEMAYGLMESKQETLGDNQGIRGVTHQRLVQYVRAVKLWIVTDRMTSKAPHTFDLVWRFPLKPSGAPAFLEKDFVIDGKTQVISTEAPPNELPPPVPGKVSHLKPPPPKINVTLYQFSTVPLTYTNKIIPTDPKNHYMAYGRNEVTAQWKFAGASQVVTLIQPRSNGQTRISSVTPLKEGDNVVGFEAKDPNGIAVSYLSAAQGTTMLKIGTVAANAESLLFSGNKGVVLGCKSLQINGTTVQLPGEDAEFSLPFNSASVIPIYRPIDPVVIGPDQNVFSGSIDTTMTSSTPGVNIHYTLDGSDPTPQSPLYSTPVKLTGYTVVKARAYRPGVTINPVETSGTLATPVSSALFTPKQLLEPDQKAVVQGDGLHFSYWQDDWKKLWLFADQIKPAVSDTATNLFDLSKIPADNPALGSNPAPRQKYYAVQYDGYLDIPKDGVYTFHAPREFVYPDIQSGYELRLFVGDKYGAGTNANIPIGLNEWYPSTRLHALGNWSIALKKGLQPFKLFFLDYRTDAAQKLNIPHMRSYVWTGSTPEILVSGPDLEKQPIPTSWFKH